MARIKDDYSILRNRIIVSVLILYGVSFVVVFIYALFTFPEKNFLQLYRAPWTLYQTVLYFIGTLIPMQCTAVLLTCSFTAPPIPSLKTGPSESFSRLVSSTIGIVILLSISFVVLSEGLTPALERRLDNLQYRTIVLRNYFDLAETSRRSGDLERSEKYLEYYLHEYPGDRAAALILSEVRKQSGGGEQDAASEQVRHKARLTELDPAGLLVMAKSSLSTEEYFTAYYFANLAADMSPFGSPNKEAAIEITSAIQERLSSYKDDKAELERKALFEVKTQGFSDLSSSEVTLNIKAYYTFLVLSQRYPEDPEPRTYLNQSIEKLSSSVFFLSEVEDILSMPGLHDLFFVNSESGAPIRQLVSIGKVIEMENGTYARDIESVTFDADGSLLSHQRASVGKILNTNDGSLAIYMRGIDPDDSTRFLEPEYLALEDGFPRSDNMVLRP
ncbi:MAG: hypothetical protein HN368_19170, partial [Spirochaetales bacterium]|nr:hypothetical protein [Spirochaetales bacterium]